MPDEIFVLSLFSILAGTGLLIYVISLIASYAKRRQQATSPDNALRTSELEAMLRRIVREELRDSGSGQDAKDATAVSGRRRFLDEHLDDVDELPEIDTDSGRQQERVPRIR